LALTNWSKLLFHLMYCDCLIFHSSS
jgi:hypothetical protein